MRSGEVTAGTRARRYPNPRYAARVARTSRWRRCGHASSPRVPATRDSAEFPPATDAAPHGTSLLVWFFFGLEMAGLTTGRGDAARASERTRRGFARLRGISAVVSGSYRDAMRSKGLASSPEAPSPVACNDALFPSRVFCPLVGSPVRMIPRKRVLFP